MDDTQRAYYDEMFARDRAFVIVHNGHLEGLVTYFIGDDDQKYLHHAPWTVIDDDPEGTTIYVDQLMSDRDRPIGRKLHKLLNTFAWDLSQKFDNVNKVKWTRVGTQFRKNGSTEGVKNVIHCKNFKF